MKEQGIGEVVVNEWSLKKKERREEKKSLEYARSVLFCLLDSGLDLLRGPEHCGDEISP
jgi:hypothetical protein